MKTISLVVYEMLRLLHIHSTNLITLPVRPPTLDKAFCADAATFETEEPAELVTLDKPSEAFETVWFALSLAFDAASPAFSVVDEACLNCCCRRRVRDCLRIARDDDMVADMLLRDYAQTG